MILANAAHLLRNPAQRIMVVGFPGTAKTGSLASLLNAGFKIRMLDFDGNPDPLLQFADKDKLKNLDIAYFSDAMRVGSRFIEPVGIPSAFPDALRMMDEWKYKDDEGNIVNLGVPDRDWGPDTILVLDSLTSMGEAAFNRAMKLMNKTPENNTDRVWGLAMHEQAAFVKKLASNNKRYHVIILAHLKIIAPRDVRKGDSPLTEKIKENMAEMIVPRMYPRALGWELPQQIGKEFPVIIEAEKVIRGGKTIRTLNLEPKVLLDLKFPAAIKDSRLPIETGMLQVFEALSPGSVALVRKENAIVQEGA